MEGVVYQEVLYRRIITLQIDIVKMNGKAEVGLPMKIICSALIGDTRTWTPLKPIGYLGNDDLHYSDSAGHIDLKYGIASDVKRLEFKVSECLLFFFFYSFRVFFRENVEFKVSKCLLFFCSLHVFC